MRFGITYNGEKIIYQMALKYAFVQYMYIFYTLCKFIM